MSESEKVVTVVPAGRARGLPRVIAAKQLPVTIEPTAELVRSKGPAARPWEATGSIDVEALVTWAIRDQKAERGAGLGLHTIERQAAGVEPSLRSTDGCATIADIAHMGCRIDAGGGLVRDHVHPAALAVAAGIGVLPDAMASSVRHFGRLGLQPSWQEPERWYRPVVWVKEGIEGQWERTGRGNSPRVTRVIPTVTLAELARRREIYRRWWEGLDQLAWRLSMRALGFAVLQPAASPAPWEAAV